MPIRHLCAFLIVAILPASADVLTFNLTSSSQSAPAGASTALKFTGTLSNPTSAVVFLNGDLSFLDQSLTLDDSPFFTFAPLSLAAGGKYSGPFFDVVVSPATPSGSYAGTFTIQGGIDDNTFGNLATANFTVNVAGSAAPEPGFFEVLLLASIIALILRKNSPRYWNEAKGD
jgi:hypothetical protein